VSLSTPGLPTSSGSNVTVEFWMDWNGSSASTMPFGFGGYDLWLANGNLGFNTLNSDLYGTSVSGLANRWVQVTAVFHNGDATQSKLYIDGVAQTLSQIYGTTTTGTVGSTAQISGFAGGSGFNFGGDMQDVAIYPTALSSTRITAHYDAGTAVGGYANNVMADSPSGYWRLGESSGTTATDSSGNGHNGTYSSTGVTLGNTGALAGDPTTSAGFDGSTGKASLSTPGLPTSSGSNVTVEFWMDWDGSSASTMPFGFGAYDLWLADGHLGFNTLNSDLYGTSVSGLANQWVQVTAVFHNGDATQSKLYINGVAQTLSQIYGTTTTGTVGSTAQISGFAGGSGFNFDGHLQDVAIYPYALSSTRVTAHYDAGTAASNPTYTYACNGDGLRMSKTTGSTTTQYTWDTVTGSSPLLLTDGSTSYLYGPDGTPLEQEDSSGNLLWYHHDQLGSTRLLTNTSGAIVGTATYDAYGRTLATTGVTTPLGYAGGYTDAESGLIYLDHRYYDPATAQFVSVDPAVAMTGAPYYYANDDPVNGSDPTGLRPAGPAIALRLPKVMGNNWTNVAMFLIITGGIIASGGAGLALDGLGAGLITWVTGAEVADPQLVAAYAYIGGSATMAIGGLFLAGGNSSTSSSATKNGASGFSVGNCVP
jgi:RHS repeat-associated protein